MNPSGLPISNFQRYQQLSRVLQRQLDKIEAEEQHAEDIRCVMDTVWDSLTSEEREEIKAALRCGMAL